MNGGSPQSPSGEPGAGADNGPERDSPPHAAEPQQETPPASPSGVRSSPDSPGQHGAPAEPPVRGADRPAAPPEGFRRFAWPPEPIRPPAPPDATPAAVPMPATAAGYGPRFVATLVDAILVVVAWLVASVVFLEVLAALGSLDPTLLEPGSVTGLQLTDAQVRIGLFMFAILIALRGFYLVYAWSRMGATFGQQLVRIRVLDVASGKPPTAGRAAVRWIVSELPGASLLISVAILVWYAAIAASIGRNASRRGIHDEAAGCIVVHQPRRGAGGAIG